ncbi:cell wall-binding repeat-containing protein [Mobiluncus curtisii]|uniref:cell wall-binding repeat-containing protein n=3 Tax=Mobiluncus curtisii TaxID=2051 RepID=UPI002016A61C|nr:cell wall-binding repeat-containing protein [Mobiluncus curtisii]
MFRGFTLRRPLWVSALFMLAFALVSIVPVAPARAETADTPPQDLSTEVHQLLQPAPADQADSTTPLVNSPEMGLTQAGQIPDPHPATVQIIIGPGPDGMASMCSGVWVGPNMVLTAAHCFKSLPQGPARIYSANSHLPGTPAVATGVTWDTTSQGDVALIVTTPANHPIAPVSAAIQPPGTPLFICGQNYIIKESATIEAVSQMIGGKGNYCANVNTLDARTAQRFQIPPAGNILATVPMAVDRGDSGGPLYNAAGEVVGITSSKSHTAFSDNSEQLLFNAASPMSRFAPWLRSLGVSVHGSEANLAFKQLPPNVMRVSGANRMETSGMIAEASPNVETLILTTGLIAADGLAATQLSGVTSSALVLSNSRNHLDSQAVKALDKFGLRRVVRVGGTVGLSAADRAAIAAKGLELVELVGTDRFDTARKVAQYRDSLGGDPSVVLVADGINFPDALAAGAAAGALHASLVLSSHASLPDTTQSYLKPLLTSAKIITVGGPAQSAVASAGINPSATYTGTDRYDTALRLATGLDRGRNVNGLVMVSGQNFPDALAAGAYTVKQGAKLVLIPPAGSKPAFLRSLWASTGSHGVIVGGTGALSDQDVAWALR